MKIYRTMEQLTSTTYDFHNRRGKVFEVKLTPDEVADAYFEYQATLLAEDIATEIDGLIEDADAGDRFSDDWPMRCGDAWCYELRDAIHNNCYVLDTLNASVADFTKRKLEEVGYDIETMRKQWR